ncbi:uncharacterized protein LOC62_04G005368 [Vanrija pseudolonga]|uniref:Uncharacterized protein n=1 Tax=Vanrija pseudolonga TaxID=143232 RepID=A0AAF0Y870_9TREE|nr:hypothetical protein LOC62_04G005368 [Vanrija pseudolonga]
MPHFPNTFNAMDPYSTYGSGTARRAARETVARFQSPAVTLRTAAERGAARVNNALCSSDWSGVTPLEVNLYITHQVLLERDEERDAGVRHYDFDTFEAARMERFGAALIWAQNAPVDIDMTAALGLCLMALQHTHTEVFDWPQEKSVPYNASVLGPYMFVEWWN